jgi:hypothetical protein
MSLSSDTLALLQRRAAELGPPELSNSSPWMFKRGFYIHRLTLEVVDWETSEVRKGSMYLKQKNGKSYRYLQFSWRGKPKNIYLGRAS